MATSITFASAGTPAVGTTSVAPVCPATVNAGDLLIMGVASKYGTPDTPSGWELVDGATKEGGIGGTGADSGNARATVFCRKADGTEGGTTVTVTCPSGNSAHATIFRYTRDVTKTLLEAATGGGHNVASGSWSATMDADIGLTTDDFTFFFSALNTDTSASSVEAATATGVTWGSLTERIDAGTSQGDDCRGVAAGGQITSGTSSAPAVYTMTCTNTPAGATVLLRFREITNTGAASITEAGDTTSADGTVSGGDISGAASITEAGDTTTAAGTVLMAGAASITEAGDTLAATGLDPNAGSNGNAPDNTFNGLSNWPFPVGNGW